MSGSTGFGTARYLREQNPALKVVLAQPHPDSRLTAEHPDVPIIDGVLPMQCHHPFLYRLCRQYDHKKKKLETLMAGGCIVQRVDENLTYDHLHSSEENLWSTLYLTGYLTKVREEDYQGELLDGMIALMIPNAEIKDIFETTVIKWFDDSTKKWNRNALFDAVWNGDSEGITKEMNALLRRTISYHDYREDFYHAFLAGIFTGAGYMVDSNKEHGEGRSDVVVYDSINARVAIFEAKYTKTLGNLESECETALQQIDDRMYAKEYEDDCDQILCYGISFFKKRCMVKKK